MLHAKCGLSYFRPVGAIVYWSCLKPQALCLHISLPPPLRLQTGVGPMGPALSWSFYWLRVRASGREPQRTGWVGGGSDVSQLFVHWQEHVPSVPRKAKPSQGGEM